MGQYDRETIKIFQSGYRVSISMFRGKKGGSVSFGTIREPIMWERALILRLGCVGSKALR
jgi:hypothetical protein